MTFTMRALVTITVLGTASACDPGSAQELLVRDAIAPPNLVMSVAMSMAAAKPLTISRITTLEAEDGLGHRVTSPVDPRALDVHAPAWPGRALDPVLTIGELSFHHYEFPAKGVMRFVVDDVARLHTGDEAWLQWGDDAASRVVLTHSLEVPK